MLKSRRYFKNELILRHSMPYFIIDFNGPHGDIGNLHTFPYLRSAFMSGSRFTPCIESIHFISDKDPFHIQGNHLLNYRNYEAPIVIKHDYGHTPVRTLPKQDLEVLANYIVR